MHRASLWLAALSISLCLFRGLPAGACSVCLPGDPHYSSLGATAGEEGSFSLYFEARGFCKRSGALPHDHEEGEEEPHDGTEESDDHRLDLYANWTPIDRLSFTLDVPVAWNQITTSEEGERTRSTLSGLGDLSLATSVVLWRDRPVLPSRWLEGRLWGKAPTGRDASKVDGERDPHLQPGSGSWDFGAGFAGVQRFEWGSLYGSTFFRRNNQGSLDYQYGNVWLATLGLEAPLGHLLGRPALDILTPGLGFDFRYAGYDEQDGERYDDSGGAILYATPSLRVQVPWGVSEQPAALRFSVQLPLGQSWLHGEQKEKEVWSVGILVPF
jgi:hypothetical protein